MTQPDCPCSTPRPAASQSTAKNIRVLLDFLSSFSHCKSFSKLCSHTAKLIKNQTPHHLHGHHLLQVPISSHPSLQPRAHLWLCSRGQPE